MKRWEELIRENVFGLGGHRDHLPASLAHMLYCIVAEEQYNLAYFFVKRIECARATSTANLPYGMFLTRLYRHVMEHYPHLDNGIYNVVDRVMRPLALKQTRKPQSDRGKARHSVSSTSAHHNYGSSSHQGDDDEDDGASRASTPSPTTYLNSLQPLNYQRYDIPTSSQQDDDLLFKRQIALLNQSQKMREEVRGDLLAKMDTKTPSPNHQLSSPSAAKAPSKTPSTKDTSSSSIDYIPKSPTSSTSPSINGYLNSPTSPPPRVQFYLLTQASGSMDITLNPFTNYSLLKVVKGRTDHRRGGHQKGYDLATIIEEGGLPAVWYYGGNDLNGRRLTAALAASDAYEMAMIAILWEWCLSEGCAGGPGRGV
ncbi:hypothetical protein Tco_1504247 [Tanacetum coccineum]